MLSLSCTSQILFRVGRDRQCEPRLRSWGVFARRHHLRSTDTQYLSILWKRPTLFSRKYTFWLTRRRDFENLHSRSDRMAVDHLFMIYQAKNSIWIWRESKKKIHQKSGESEYTNSSKCSHTQKSGEYSDTAWFQGRALLMLNPLPTILQGTGRRPRSTRTFRKSSQNRLQGYIKLWRRVQRATYSAWGRRALRDVDIRYISSVFF